VTIKIGKDRFLGENDIQEFENYRPQYRGVGEGKRGEDNSFCEEGR